MRQSEKAMAVLAVGVLAYEYFCNDGETISDWFDTALEKHPVITFLGTVAVGAHILNVYENYGVEHIDPIHRVAELKSKGRNEQ